MAPGTAGAARPASRLPAAPRRIVAAGLVALAFAPGPARAGLPLDPISLADARAGLAHLYHSRPAEAAAAFERVRDRNPHSPAADFLLGGIEWQRVTTGPQGATAGGEAETAFFARMDAAIDIGEKAIARDPDDLAASFFLGGAYGYKARYLALQEKWWDAYRHGRRGVKHLETVVDKDPTFADAYLGLGIYHYYADVLPSVLKFFGNFIGLNGDRERGLREIHRALADGTLVNEECRFFLAEIESTFEEDQWEALGYSRSLRDEYPENELFTWLNARILDELHLTDLSTAEWTILRGKARGRRLTGFVDYRLARSRLFGGDFAGAAAYLDEALKLGRLGSRRITMWGRLRYGVALDFLGRHSEAMLQYSIVKELDASDSAKDRASARLDAGRRDPAVISIGELAETARILKETGVQGEEDLRRVERLVTEPPRGLSRNGRAEFFAVLADLAEARLRRGDPEGCVAAIDRALALSPRPRKGSRAILLALRGRARYRLGRPDEALADLKSARGLADWVDRKRIERDRDLIAALAPGAPPAPRNADVVFRARDRGEILLEVELPGGRRPMTLDDGMWIAAAPGGADATRYRFVADGEERRVDPYAPIVVLEGDGAWCRRAQPKQTNSSPSR